MTLWEFDPPRAFDAGDMRLDKHTWVEPKLDGVRALLHVHPEHGLVVKSRRRNKAGEYNPLTDVVPHFKDDSVVKHLQIAGYTILDGELIMPEREGSSLGNTMGVVGSLPERAIELQKKYGLLEFWVFDIPMYRNVQVADKEFIWRRGLLQEIFGRAEPEQNIKLVEANYYVPSDNHKFMANNYIALGYEGMVAKNERASYFERGAWAKFKQQDTVDAIVTGFKQGTGKYSNTLGALSVAVIDQESGKLREIAWVAPGDDSTRNEMYSILNGKTLQEVLSKGIVVELEGQGWSTHGRIRHPRINRYRTDKVEPNTVNFKDLKVV